MSDSTTRPDPDALFVVACPVCEGRVAASGGLCGCDACCPLCASLFHVPFPEPEVAAEPELATAADGIPQATAPPADGPSGMAEDWESVIRRLDPPRREPETATPVAPLPQDAFALPGAEPALPAPQTDDFVFRDPVRTVRHGGAVIEIRRLTPEERRLRRLRRNLLMIVVGTSILVAIVILLSGPPKGR